MDDNEDGRLFEALTLERLLVPPKTPPFQCYSKYNQRYWNYWGAPWPVHNPGNHYDIEYRNTEGKLHRIYGPAYIGSVYSVEVWYKDGVMHREGGPAYIHNYNMVWFKEGKLHRLDGPAVIEGAGPKQFWIDGVRYSPKEYKKEIARRKRKGSIK